MISPTRPRWTPSGLTAMKVRSAWAMVLQAAGALRTPRQGPHRPHRGPGPGPRGHVAPAPARRRFCGDTWPPGGRRPAAAPRPTRAPAEGTRQGPREEGRACGAERGGGAAARDRPAAARAERGPRAGRRRSRYLTGWRAGSEQRWRSERRPESGGTPAAWSPRRRGPPRPHPGRPAAQPARREAAGRLCPRPGFAEEAGEGSWARKWFPLHLDVPR